MKKQTSKETSFEQKEKKPRENILQEKATDVDVDTDANMNTNVNANVNANADKKRKKSPIITYFILVILLFLSLAYFVITIINQDKHPVSIETLVSQILLVLFTISFVLFGMTSRQKGRGILFGSALLLSIFFVGQIGTTLDLVNFSSSTLMEDLRGKTLTEVITWASKNKVEVKQVYEYSDMIEEYNVISQSIAVGTKLKKGTSITLAISEGPNPNKEIMVPSMMSWNVERVLNFVKENYLSNVEVEFIESDKAKDTVIEQSKKGSMKRDEELKLTFSYGESRDGDTVKLIDLTKKSKFEAVLYLKQQGIKYELKDDFHKSIKKGYVMRQNKEAGSEIKRNEDTLEVTISKGPEIKVPDLKKMSLTEITNWIIKNKLKLDLKDKYDESIKENDVIAANYQKNDVISQGTVIEITISKGKLVMPKVENLEKFKEWADKYGIQYEEKHEFSSDVEAGSVISYSYKTGETIKNNDVVIITISDGKKLEVPDLIGLKKSEIESQLKKLGLQYNFVYKASNRVDKDKAIAQSISKGSEVSEGTTITITLSNGKKEVSSSSNNQSSSSSNNNSSSNSNSNSNQASPPAQETPSCDTSKKTTVYIYDELLSDNPTTTCSNIKKAYPNVKFSCTYQKGTGLAQGMLVNSAQIDSKQFDHCNTVTLKISQN